ncbi:MAG: SPW repeat protein [Sulfurifustaceae bacterium]
MLTRVIPTKAHAGMDYLVGILLIAAPWIFGFSDETTAGSWISVLAGVAVLGLSAITNYEGGLLAHAVTMRMHLFSDALLGIFLAASPWLFGFADHGANAWLPFVLIGASELLAAGMTNPFPDDRSMRSREAARAA